MSERTEHAEIASSSELDLTSFQAVWLGLLGVLLLVIYYFPYLSGQSDYYFSDIAFYFEPFARFIRQQIEAGIFPLWNPYVYSGMSQIAVPSPGLFYPFSWLIFLLPFSAGLSIYMIIHQVLFGLGAYLYFRDLRSSRAASMLGALAVALCAYSFSLIRNFTLPGSMAWLPLALWCERNIDFARIEGRSRQAGNAPEDLIEQVPVAPQGCTTEIVWYSSGLLLCVAMIMYAGRPEVGAPELVVIGIACVSKFARLAFQKQLSISAWQELILKLCSLGLGVALSFPMIGPVLDWTRVSPRATGMAAKWVFTWSSNWYDFLGLVLSQPMGDLSALNDQAMHLRGLVSSRGSHVPFLSSSYISPVIANLSLWGAFDRRFKMRWIVFALLAGFVFMTLGNYTPVAPAIVSLSTFFATFRYPVKLLIFPAILLILLAVRGLDCLLEGRLRRELLDVTTGIWIFVLAVGIIFSLFPQIVIQASKWSWLFQAEQPRQILQNAQLLMAGSMLHGAAIGIASCVVAYLVLHVLSNRAGALKETEKSIVWACSLFLILLTSHSLAHSSMRYRQFVPFGFFNHPSTVAQSLQKFNLSSATIEAFRVVNLYFDPLTVPKSYKARKNSSFEEDFFQYARELCLYKTVMDHKIPCSNGYEAAESAYYRDFFIDALQFCSQAKHETEKRISDLPMHRFAILSATAFANTQCYRDREGNNVPPLDSNLFEKIEENEQINHRLFKVRNPRPRIYFAEKIEPVENFDKLRHEFCQLSSIPIDSDPGICYLKQTELPSVSQSRSEDGTRSKGIVMTNGRSTRAQVHPRFAARKGGPVTLLAGGSPAPNSAMTEINILRDSGEDLFLSVKTPSPRLLIIADHFFPGWTASIDNTETKILQANIINRAILVPPGRHEIRMSFKPQSMTIGFLASAAAFIISSIAFCVLSRTYKPEARAKEPAV